MNENMAITGFPLTDLIIRGYLWFANKHIGGFDVISTQKNVISWIYLGWE